MRFSEKKLSLANKKTCVFRSLLATDAEATLAFLCSVSEQTLFLNRYPEEVETDVEAEAKMLSDSLSDPASVMIAAFCEDGLVAVGSIYPVARREKIKHRASMGIAVLSAYWGMGIGTMLLNEMILCAALAGYEQVELSVARENSRAIRLYQRHDFEVYGRLENAFKFRDGSYCDEYFMAKRLNRRYT